jgi:hypothetical protein
MSAKFRYRSKRNRNQYLKEASMLSDDAECNSTDEPILIATVDLDRSAIETLKRLGWLDEALPDAQMAVNEACTSLLSYALSMELTSRSGG